MRKGPSVTFMKRRHVSAERQQSCFPPTLGLVPGNRQGGKWGIVPVQPARKWLQRHKYRSSAQ